MSTPYNPANRGSKFVTPGSGSSISGGGSDISRILPRQVSTGTLRGTQNVGYGGVQIDGSNNRINISANGTQIVIGDTSANDQTTGISLVDTSNNQNLVLLGKTIGEDSTTGLTIYDSTNTRRFLGGVYPDGEIHIKLSQPNVDVATATDSQIIWSSEFDLFKIVKTGSVSHLVASLASGATDTTTIAHGLTGIPAAIIYINGSGSTYLTANQFYILPQQIPVTIAGVYQAGIIYSYSIDSTNLYLTVSNYTSAGPILDIGTANWKYYLLQETAATT